MAHAEELMIISNSGKTKCRRREYICGPCVCSRTSNAEKLIIPTKVSEFAGSSPTGIMYRASG